MFFLVFIALIKDIDLSIKYNNDSSKKIEEFLNFRGNIENRIREIEFFYEKHFDEPFALNFEKGRLELKKLLMNVPYNLNLNINEKEKIEFMMNSNKYNDISTSMKSINYRNKKNILSNNINAYTNMSNSIINNYANSVKNFTEIKNNVFSPKHLNRSCNQSTTNFNKKINDINDNNNEYSNDHSNDNTKDNKNNDHLFNYNIFGDKLISNFSKKEKDLKPFEQIRKISKKPNKKEKTDINKKNDKNNDKNNEKNNKNLKNKISTSNEQLKEISFKIILDEDEYCLLVKEKAKRINPLKNNY